MNRKILITAGLMIGLAVAGIGILLTWLVWTLIAYLIIWLLRELEIYDVQQSVWIIGALLMLLSIAVKALFK